MMDRYVTTLHTPESHVAVVDVDAGTATGVVNGHGELALGDRLLLAAYRYDDRYVRLDGRWVFEARTIRFMYNVPFEEMATSFADRNRLRVPGTAGPRATTPRRCPPGPPPSLVPFPGKRHLPDGAFSPEKAPVDNGTTAAGIGNGVRVSATRQLLPGVFVGSHAIAEGFLTRGQLRRRGFRRLVQGVYADPGLPFDHQLKCRGVALLLPDGAVIGGHSAAAWWGAPFAGPTDPVTVLRREEVTVARPAGRPRPPDGPARR